MATLLRVPHLGTAEDEVLLAAWNVAPGQAFAKGQALCCVETLKASFEVEAEAAGVLAETLVAAGERVAVHAPLAILTAPGEACDARQRAALLAAQPASPAPAATTRAPAAAPAPPAGAPGAAPAARARARELGVDLATVHGTGPGGMVRVADVEAAHARSGAAGKGGDGRLDPGFVSWLRRDGEAFARLASGFKVELYRRHGAQLAGDVHLGPGALLRVERLVLGPDAFFGADTTVDAVEFTAGPLAHFGARCRVRCRRIALGENAFFADDVEVGGGGAMDPEAELVVGSHGFVGEHVHLNPCRTLRLGDEVVVSRGAVLMTHSFGGSVLAGYPNRFAPVTIADRCQIGIGAVLFPGTEMGEGSILLNGSSLVTAVPAARLYGGVPARDLKAAAQPLSAERRQALAADLVREFARQLRLRGRQVEVEELGARLEIRVHAEDGVHRLGFAPRLGDLPAGAAAETVLVAMAASAGELAALPVGTHAIELATPRIHGGGGPLCDAFREFVRKRGVRLHPRGFAYRGGWL